MRSSILLVLPVVVAVGAAGRASAVCFVDLDCPDHFVCDPDAGECEDVRVVPCTTDADCAGTASGKCTDGDCYTISVSCGNDGDRFPEDDDVDSCDDDDNDDDGEEDGDEPVTAEAGDPVNVQQGNLLRSVTDIQTFGNAAIPFTRLYNSRTLTFNAPYWDFGNQQTWQHNWNYEMRQLSTTTNGFFDIKVRYPNGREYNFTATDTAGDELAPTVDNGDRLYRWPGSTVGYTMITPRGWEYHFQRVNSPKFQMLEVRDGQGAVWTLTHDTNAKITRIENQYGRYLDIVRDTVAGVEVIVAVQASDGREVTYSYDTWTPTGNPVLVGVAYPDGEAATYGWAGSDSLTTGRPVLASAVDPMDGGPNAVMDFEYNYNAIYDVNGQNVFVTGTILNEVHPVTGLPVFSMPAGSGDNTRLVQGTGGVLRRRFANGLLTTLADPMGHTTKLERSDGGFGPVIAVHRPNGGVTTFERDYANRRTLAVNACNGTHSYVYNDDGFLVSVTDEGANTTTITRDTDNFVTRIDYPDESFETWTHDSNGLVLTHTAKNGETTTYDYYGASEAGGLLGDLKSVTDPLEGVTTYTHDDAGRVTSVTDPLGNSTSFQYDARGHVTQTTFADSTTVAYVYDDFGNPTSITDELGHTWTMTYNEFHRLASVTNPLSETRTIEYGLSPDDAASAYLGTVARVTSAAGVVVERTYNLDRKLAAITMAPGTADEGTWTRSYDDGGDLVSILDPLGHETTFEVDLLHRVTAVVDALGNRTETTYDDVGNVATTVLPDEGVVTNTWDSMRRLTAREDPAGRISTFDYDASGNLIALSDANNHEHDFTYDELNRRTSLIYPDASHEDWTYDAGGNLATYATRAGQVRTHAYDQRNREVSRDWSDGTPDVLFTRDDAGRVLAIETGTLEGGALSTVATTVTYTYDTAGRRLTEASDISMSDAEFTAATTAFAYDDDGQLAELAYPDGPTITYLRDARGRVYSVGAGGLSPLASYTYDAGGRKTALAFENGTSTSYSYDDANRLLSVAHVAGASPIASFDYEIDARGRRTSIAGALPGLSSRTDSYTYDAAGQLTGVDYGSSQQMTYSYDDVGNRLSVVDSANGTTSYAVNTSNEYTAIGAQSPTYDDNGNTTSFDDGWTYAYDAEGRLVSAVSRTLRFSTIYDGIGRPVERTLLAESAPEVVISQVYGAGGNIGSTLANDFVELHNRSEYAVSIAGWSLQYASATGSTWAKTNLSGTIAAGAYYLIGLAAGGQGGTAIPTPDATGTTNIHATTGKIALSNSTTTLSGSCPTGAAIVDFVGYGSSANCYEGTGPTPLPSGATKGVQRAASGCTDTADNSADLANATATPHNSTSTAACDIWVEVERYALIYNGWQLIEDRSPGNTVQAAYVNGAQTDEVLARMTSGETLYFHADGSGSVTALTDGSAEPIESYRYDVYGTAAVYDGSGNALTTSGAANRVLFAGREWLERPGLYDLRHRLYDPGSGRFLTKDPMGFAGGDTNFYAYVMNDPANLNDPFGLCPECSPDIPDLLDQAHKLAELRHNAATVVSQHQESHAQPRLNAVEANAVIHCVATCMAARQFNQPIAVAVADGREALELTRQPPHNEALDVCNNHSGLRNSTKEASCRDSCLDDLSRGSLSVGTDESYPDWWLSIAPDIAGFIGRLFR